MNKDLKILKKSFIIEWWPTDCYAHGNSDYEHYYVKWFDAKNKKIRETDYCDGPCGSLPFDNVDDEFEKFDNMGKRDYWMSYGVPAEWIKDKSTQTCT